MLYVEIALTLGTWALVAVTVWMVRRQSSDLRSDLKARFQLEFIDRFDSPRFIEARKELAQRLISRAPHEEIPETVMEFFEDMGLFLKHRYLDEELLWSTFGYYGVRWWEACQFHARRERERQADHTLFEDFEHLVQSFEGRDERKGLKAPDAEDMARFLTDEADL